MDYNKKALEMHKENKGKLAVQSKIPLKNKDDLSIAYTPGVGEVSRVIAEDPKNAEEYTFVNNTVAVISDGSAVLGLGNIGALASLPVMEGKAVLFKELAGIDAFPICLKEQDVEKTIETVKNISPVFGGINLEDIKAPECFVIEERLQDLGIPVMHDDQHGTAVVVLAGLTNAIKLRETSKENAKIVISGAGAAGVAITKLLALDGYKNLLLLDSKGIIAESREDLNEIKKEMLSITNKDNESGNLEAALTNADVFIGVSKPNIVTKEMIEKMNKDPIIFAMSNPIPEVMPDIAKEAGAFIIATGRSDFPNQVNNAIAFPGIFRGALDIKAKRITNDMKLAASHALAELVENPSPDIIIPNPFNDKIVPTIAEAVKKAYKEE